MSKTIYFFKGLPGSGKTTQAKKLLERYPEMRRVNKDDIRAMIAPPGYSSPKESSVIAVRNSMIRTFLINGYTVLVDDTNLNPIHYKAIRTIANEFPDTEVEIMDFLGVPLETCIERDAGRENPVGEAVIRSMHKKWILKEPMKKKHEPITVERKYLDQSHLKNWRQDAIIVDVDGTLALMNGRSPYDWDKVGEDRINEPVANIVREEFRRNTRIIIVTGRDGVCLEKTKTWLNLASIPFHDIYIRPQGDYRPDSEIKKEIFDRHIKHQYHIKYVLDDRDQVVKIWREIGLLCLQVAEGNF